MSEILNQAAAWATVGALIPAVVSLGVIAFQVRRYMAVRDADLRQREFENYHRLIRDLAQGGQEIRIASQTAIIYELRNYPKYADVTLRILKSLKNEFESAGRTRLSEEMTLTLHFLENRKGQK